MSTIIMNGKTIEVRFPVTFDDCRPEDSMELFKKLYINKDGSFKRAYYKQYPVGIKTMERGLEILQAHHNTEICVIDGENGRHLLVQANYKTKNGIVTCIFISSSSSITVVGNKSQKHYEFYNCKEFLTLCKKIRDEIIIPNELLAY